MRSLQHEVDYCRVCGDVVDPKKDVMFGALGKPLFAAHAGACADQVRGGVGLVSKLVQGVLKRKAPGVLEAARAAERLREQLKVDR